jgi:L-fuculose-phosphate aldolase
MDEDQFLVTPSGHYKMTMEPDDPLLVNQFGEVLVGKPGLKPTSELDMHMQAYSMRPDIKAVLHAHPPYATALTLLEIPFPTDFLPEVLIALGDVPIAPYATPGTPKLGKSIQEQIKQHNSVLLSHHGSINVGRSLEEALIALERLEHAAYTYYLARVLGDPIPLPHDELEHLRSIGGGTQS